MKKAQLKELCTQYDCFVGFNHGEPAGRLSLRELGKPGPIGDANATKYNKEAEANYKGYLRLNLPIPFYPLTKVGLCGSIHCRNMIPSVFRLKRFMGIILTQ